MSSWSINISIGTRVFFESYGNLLRQVLKVLCLGSDIACAERNVVEPADIILWVVVYVDTQ